MGRLGRGSDIRRRRPSRAERRRLLVVTEGEKTEPQYVLGLMRLLRATAVDVRSVDVQAAGVTHPVGVVREAIRIARGALDQYDEVWALVDVDDHAGLQDACVLATDESVRLTISNPAFETWLLWHYQDQRASLTRSEYAAR
jgi:hypothetical protein